MERVGTYRRRVGVMLVLLLLGDFTLVQPSPAPGPARLSALTNKDPMPSDLNSLPVAQSLSLDNTESHSSHGLPSVEEVYNVDDNSEDKEEEAGKEHSPLSEKLLLEMVLDLEGNDVSPEAEEELTDSLSDAIIKDVQEGDFLKVIDKGLKQRQEKVTAEVLKETSQVMEHLAAFEEAVPSDEEWMDSVRGLCGQQVVTTVQRVVLNLGESGGVFQTLTIVALLQLHNCPSAALLLATRLVNVLDTAQSSTASLPPQGPDNTHAAKDQCQDFTECRQRYISTVRQILSRYSSLVALYDAAATAVFAASHNTALTEALLKNVLGDLHISTNHIHIQANSQSLVDGHRLSKRGSCVDKGEQKAQKIISWIPFIGTLYNLISSAVYAGKGCKDVAKERARDGALDLVMDAATVLTGGAAAGIATGAKTLAKVGIKAGLKAGLKAGAKTGAKAFKKIGKKMLKETVKGYKNPLKGAAKEVKDTLKTVVKGVKAIPKAVKAVPKVVKAVPKAVKSLPKSIKNGASGLKKFVKQVKKAGKEGGKKVDDLHVPRTPDSPSLGSKADRKVDSAVGESSHIICKRSPGKRGACEIPNYETLQDKMRARATPQYQKRLLDRFENLWNTHNPVKLNSPPVGRQYVSSLDSRTFYSLDLTGSQMKTKKLLEALQQTRQSRATRELGLQVRMDIGGSPVEFVSVPSEWTNGYTKNAVGQVGIFTKEGNRFKPMSYEDIWSKMDDFADTPQKRLQVYKAMEDTLEATPNQGQTPFANAFGNTDKGRKAQAATTDLLIITNTAEAMPPLSGVQGISGRTVGADALFRGALERQIANQGQTSFQDFIKTLPFSPKGGAGLMRKVAKTKMRKTTLVKKGIDVDGMAESVDDISSVGSRSDKK